MKYNEYKAFIKHPIRKTIWEREREISNKYTRYSLCQFRAFLSPDSAVASNCPKLRQHNNGLRHKSRQVTPSGIVSNCHLGRRQLSSDCLRIVFGLTSDCHWIVFGSSSACHPRNCHRIVIFVISRRRCLSELGGGGGAIAGDSMSPDGRDETCCYNR